ncbi:hypothetical protein DPEC_G00018510 [Dallia pectoralis]|uniref:Uncharacterized protein n=1 Tax=Dallia pectoralis TaxID=75939 RepID=A0ACC2HFB9_DALPE|nr:hypothetical protein DPEC_G00018510 [Dallia pectoralis]
MMKTVSQGNPDTEDELVQLIETFGATKALVRAGGSVKIALGHYPSNEKRHITAVDKPMPTEASTPTARVPTQHVPMRMGCGHTGLFGLREHGVLGPRRPTKGMGV